jgi:hypothetical protein
MPKSKGIQTNSKSNKKNTGKPSTPNRRGGAQIETTTHVGMRDFIKMHILMNKYSKYAMSDKGKATLFVKKHLKKANNTVWIEIIEIDAPKHYEIGYMQFKTVVCELFPRTIKSQYPPKRQYPDKNDYNMICRAIDWETAEKDIKAQKRKGTKGIKYRIEGAIILNQKDRPPMFIKSAPDSIKALANDIKDKSSPAWEVAYKYLSPEYMDYDEYQYKIKKINKIE